LQARERLVAEITRSEQKKELIESAAGFGSQHRLSNLPA